MQNVIISFESTLQLINRIINPDKGDNALFLELLIKTFLCGRSESDILIKEIIQENGLEDFFSTPEAIQICEEIRKTIYTYLPQFKSYLLNHQIDHDFVNMINPTDCCIFIDKNKLISHAQTT